MYTVDELHDLDFIVKIFNQPSIIEFFNKYIFDTTVHYHGFLTLFIPGLIGYIPSIFLGDSAYIASMRLTSQFLISISYLIFTISITKDKFKQFCIFALLISTSVTNFYSFIPRVESYQYFFLSLVIYFYSKEKRLSKKSFIFLGLACASRVSTFSFIPFIYLFYLFQENRKLWTPIIFSYLGFTLGQPNAINPYYFIEYINRKRFMVFDDTGRDSSLNFLWWISESINPVFSNTFISLLVLIITFTLCCFILWKKRDNNKLNLLNIFALVSLLNILLISNFVKLTYSFWYNHLHIILIIVFIFYYFIEKFEISNTKKNFGIVLFTLFIISVRIPTSPTYKGTHYEYKEIINKVSSNFLDTKIYRYNLMIKILNFLKDHTNEQFSYKVDIHEFYPDIDQLEGHKSHSDYTLAGNNMDHPQHLIIFRNITDYKFNAKPIKGKTIDYSSAMAQFDFHNKFVSKIDNGNCEGTDCYRILLIDNSEITPDKSRHLHAYIKEKYYKTLLTYLRQFVSFEKN